MKIEKIGRTPFAFGMTWAEVDPQELKTVLEDLDEKAEVVHYLTQGQPKRGPFGLGRKAVSEESSKVVLGSYLGPISGRVASYAGTLASVAENGFYVARVNDDLLWYCSIHNGRVITGSDLILPRVSVIQNISGLLSSFSTGLYVDEHCMELFRQEGFMPVEFDPVRIIAKAKPAWLTRRGTSKGEMVVAGVIAVSAIVGFSWLYTVLFPAPPVNTGPTPEEIRAMYLSNVRQMLPSVSADPQWAPRAFGLARTAFPPFRSGWTLQSVSCTPRNGCSGSYAPMSDGIWFSHEAFGVPSVANRMASRSVDTPTPLVEPTDEELLYSFPHYGRPAGEVVGTFGLRFPVDALLGEPQIENISSNAGNEMPEGAVQLVAEKIVVGQPSVPDFFLMRKVTEYFAADGFRPSQFAFSHGYGTANSSWKIEFVRLRSEN